MVFHNSSNYDYNFIVKQSVEEFKGQFKCLGENTEKFMNFSVPIEKQENAQTIKYKIRFIHSVRFMVGSLSSLTDNLAEGLLKGKCKDGKSCLEYMTPKKGLLTFKCVDCNKTYGKKFDEDLVKRFENTYWFVKEEITNSAERCLSISLHRWLVKIQ